MFAKLILVLSLMALVLVVGEALPTSRRSAQTRAVQTAATGSSNSGANSRAVILELFTSEGCSSCPPADSLLKQLDDLGHLENAEVIALEEHVDYWDHQGWRDPFSSHDWTERQQKYAEALRHDGVYTPQFLVNGRGELVRSSSNTVRQSILDGTKIPAANLRVSGLNISERSADLSIMIENIPSEAHSAQLWLAVTERGLSSSVLGGENKGRLLPHAPVLRALSRIRIPKSNSSGAIEARASIRLDHSWKRENLRFIAFLQAPDSLQIFGAAASDIRR